MSNSNNIKEDDGFAVTPGKFSVNEMNFSHEKNSKFIVVIMNDGVDSRVLVIDWHGSVAKCEVAAEFPK